MSYLFVLLQYLLPHHLLSNLVGYFAQKSFLKNFFIRSFIRYYKVDMNEALLSDPSDYPNFNAFFTRELKLGTRPIPAEQNIVVCPVDGEISAIGSIQNDKLLQAKSREFNLRDLLAGDETLAKEFLDGCFATVYLSPRDYHRVHLPLAGSLIKTIYIPGRLFSVNKMTTDSVSNLFARNERIICIFSTKMGTMCVILVGALIVSGIEMVWANQIAPKSKKYSIIIKDYNNHQPPIKLSTGAEIGRFKLGSTAIALFPRGKIKLEDSLKVSSQVRMGQILGKIR